jgi:S1-C subfamily serine protease
VITAVNGIPVSDADTLVRIVTRLEPGTAARFSIVRGDRRRVVAVQLGARAAR